MYSVLIVNAEDKDTYGTVWYYDFANDVGLFPFKGNYESLSMP